MGMDLKCIFRNEGQGKILPLAQMVCDLVGPLASSGLWPLLRNVSIDLMKVPKGLYAELSLLTGQKVGKAFYYFYLGCLQVANNLEKEGPNL